MTARPLIVLDPGHGGSTPTGGSSPNNATGANGLLEKDLTLDLVRRVRDRITKEFDVRMTRDSDLNLSLAERARIARDNRAAVFLSVHFNGASSSSVDGCETWIGRSGHARRGELARSLTEQVAYFARIRNRGTFQRDLGVLEATRHHADTVPCLLEVAFLSNPTQAGRLRDESYKNGLADAIATGLRSYFAGMSLPAPNMSRATGSWALEASEGDRIVAELDPSLGSYAAYRAQIVPAKVFGVSVEGGVHRDLLPLLRKAEKEAAAVLAPGGGAVNWRVQRIAGFQERGNWGSWHRWGMAIDIDYATNPYIMHEAGESDMDKQLEPVYQRIARLMLGRDSVIPVDITRGGMSAARTDTLHRRLADESEAMYAYFYPIDHGGEPAVKNLIDGAAQRSPGPDWKGIWGQARQPMPAELLDEIMRDYVTLTGKAGPAVAGHTYPKVKAVKGDRPFANAGAARDPRHGFLTIRHEIAVALSRAGLRWGAIDFGGASGDVMHFDGAGTPLGKRIAAARAAAKKATAKSQAQDIAGSLAPFVAGTSKPTVADGLELVKILSGYFGVPWNIPYVVLEHEAGVAKMSHPDGAMQTTAKTREIALQRLPRALKLALLGLPASDTTPDAALATRLLAEFPRRLAVQLAAGIQVLADNLRAVNGYVSLALQGYNAGTGTACKTATQGKRTSRPPRTSEAVWEEMCRFGAGLLHQPVKDLRIDTGTWRCDANIPAWYRSVPVYDVQTGQQLYAFGYLRSFSGCIHKTKPTTPCVKANQGRSEAGSGDVVCTPGRAGVLDKLYRPELLARDYYAAARRELNALTDDGLPLKVVDGRVVKMPLASGDIPGMSQGYAEPAWYAGSYEDGPEESSAIPAAWAMDASMGDQIVAAIDPALGNYENFKKKMVSAKLFDLPIVGGVHPDMLPLLKKAEQNAHAAIAPTGGPVDWGVRRIAGFQQRPSWTSKHTWGLAIDIDYAANPYIMHESRKEALEPELRPVYHRIARLLLGRDSVVPVEITRGKMGAARTATLYDRLAEESRAMVDYFAPLDGGERLVESMLANAGKRTPAPDWKAIWGEARVPSTAEFLDRIMRDYVILSGRKGPAVSGHAYPKPGKLADKRPFSGTDKERDPRRGFLTIRREIAEALSGVGLRWGAVDLGGASGDVMHFDGEYLPLGRRIMGAAAKLAKASEFSEEESGYLN